MKTSQKIKSLFWIVLVISVLILSWVGLSQLYPETNTLRYLPDRIFRMIKILMGNDPSLPKVEPKDIPFVLIIVKILTTIILMRALLKIVEKVFHEQYTQLAIALKKNHTIVIGIGNKGSRILKDYKKQTGRSAVAIEQKSDHKNISSLRRNGHAILVGDAADEDTLLTAGALKAQNIICFSNDEQTGIQIAGKLAALYARKKPKHLLRCFVHLDNPRLVEVFRHHSQCYSDQGMDVRFFNMHKMVARQFFHQLPSTLASSLLQPNVHIRFLLFGFDAAAQALLIQGMRVFHLLPGQSCEWYVLAHNMAAKASSFFDRYPQIGQIAPLHLAEDKACYAQLLAQYTKDQAPPVQTVAMCASEDDDANLLIAAELIHASPHQNWPVYVLNTSGKAMDSLLDGQASARLHFFGDYDDFCKFELITNARQDDLAQAMHNDYLKQISGTASESVAYQQSWDRLSEDAKDANRAQADHIIYKLLLTGKLDALQKPAALTFSADEVEQLAMAEHARWAAHRYLNAWQYGAVRDNQRKLHPSLISWNALSENEKQKDRHTVLRLPEILRTIHGVQL